MGGSFLKGGSTGSSGNNILGQAQFRIMLDTMRLRQDSAEAVQLLRSIENAVSSSGARTARSAQVTGLSFGALTKSIGAAGIALMGLQSGIAILRNIAQETAAISDAMFVAEQSFIGYTGSAERARDIMKELRDYARENRIPVGTTVAGAQQLLPGILATGGNANQLTQAMDLARRLTVINPDRARGGGFEGALFAIVEMLQGQMRSLNQRFTNLGGPVTEAAEQFGGDKLAALDQVLNSLGATTEVANKSMNTISNSIEVLKQNFQLLLSDAFQPIIQGFIIPAIQGVNSLIMTVDRGDSKLLNLIGKIAQIIGLVISFIGVIIALGAATLVFISTIGPLKILKAIFEALAAAVAGFIGIGDIDINLDDLIEDLKRSLFIVVAVFANYINMFDAAGQTFNKVALLMVGKLLETVGLFTIELSKSLPGGQRSKFGMLATEITTLGQIMARDADAMDDFSTAMEKGGAETNAFIRNFGELLGLLEKSEMPTDTRGETDTNARAFTDEQIDMWIDYQEEIQDLTKDHQQKLIQLEEDYRNEIAQRTADYNRDRRRDQEDFDRDQANREVDLANKIAALQTDETEKRRELEKEHRENITEITSTYNEDAAQALADHQLRMLRMQEDHQEALDDAAGRLDALAFIREIQKFNKERSRAEQDFAKEQNERQKQFSQKIAQEISHYQESLLEQRKSNADKIKEMQAQFNQERERARAEFNIKMQRRAEDFAIEMQRLRDEQTAKVTEEQIGYNNSLQQLKTSFEDRFLATARHLENINSLFVIKEKEALAGLTSWWDAVVKTFETQSTQSTRITDPMPRREVGGNIPFTGAYFLHAGENVQTRAAIRQQAVQPTTANKSIVLNMPISITGIANPDEIEARLRRVAKVELITSLQEYG